MYLSLKKKFVNPCNKALQSDVLTLRNLAYEVEDMISYFVWIFSLVPLIAISFGGDVKTYRYSLLQSGVQAFSLFFSIDSFAFWTHFEGVGI